MRTGFKITKPQGRQALRLAFIFLVNWFLGCSLFGAEKFDLRDGDRVAFIGGVFIERENEEGHIETMLTRNFIKRKVMFRNFGWGGDTVETFVQPTFEPRPKYVPTLFDYVGEFKPTVLLVSYGMMESYRGETGLADFSKNYNALIDKLVTASRASDSIAPRIVLISPSHHENLNEKFLEAVAHNKILQLYVNAVEKIARERNCTFVNLFETMRASGKHPLTSNGIHLNSTGYSEAATAIETALGISRTKLKGESEESLRDAIVHKNKQWWFHYRPMNSEYVYRNGTRFQDRIGDTQEPLDLELAEFAKLTKSGDAEIARLRSRILKGENVRPARKATPESRRTQRDPKAPDPELERKSFQVADGFEVNLFAADPLINKPIQIAFDERGRLFVATTTLYPQIKPGEKATDKIIMLEDDDGDGRADKTTVFADELYIPTGVLPGNGGLYTFDDTTFLHFRDRDDDGRADEKEIILSGFGTEDSHHKGHVLRYGPGGNIYFNQGVFLHSTIETAHGIVHHSGNWLAGIFEYQPATRKFEVYLANSVPPNPWGHYWNRWGFDFHIDSSGQQGSNFILPNANKTSSAIPVPGGQGKLAGGEIISGRHFPDDWQGDLISAPFKENRVARWSFSDDGSGYALKQLAPLIVSTDNAFRPVDMRMGPDGALYIADWYNPLIGHMQHHFRDPGRDFTHGRIWRVTAKNRALVPRFNFAKASVAEILEQLKATEDFNRAQARRILSERNRKEVLPALAAWVEKLSPTESDDHHRLEALWTYQTMNVVEPNLLKRLLRAKTSDARAAATSVLRYWHDKIPESLDLLSTQIADDQPRVRLQAVITLSHIPDSRSVEIAARALDKPMDKYLEQALKNTANALKSNWLPALKTGGVTFGGSSKHLQFALEAVDQKNAVKPLVELLQSGRNTEKYIEMIATIGGVDDLAALYYKDFDPSLQAKALEQLANAARDRKMIPKVETKRLKEWIVSPNAELKGAALKLVDAWNLEELRPKPAKAATKKPVPAPAQKPVVTKPKIVEVPIVAKPVPKTNVIDEAAKERSAAIERDAMIALQGAAANAAQILAIAPVGNGTTEIFDAFFQRKGGSEALANAIKTIHPDNAKIGLRRMRATGRQDEALLKKLSEAAGLNAETKDMSRAEMEPLVREVQKTGNAENGEKIFHREELNCLGCHAIAGAGGQLGPDLSAVGGGSTVDYLIESILFPNKVIKDGFETLEVTTKDDEYFLGVRVRESGNELVLKDATRNEIVFPLNTIKERKSKSVSLMPAGLHNSLTHSELIDLVRFMSELGKPGAYANNPKAIVRKWEILGGVLPETALAKTARFSWTPAYSYVSGLLPLETWLAKNKFVLARFGIHMTTPGKIQLKLHAPAGFKMWVNSASTELEPDAVLDLPTGPHQITFLVNATERAEELRVEVEETPGSAARFQLAGND